MELILAVYWRAQSPRGLPPTCGLPITPRWGKTLENVDNKASENNVNKLQQDEDLGSRSATLLAKNIEIVQESALKQLIYLIGLSFMSSSNLLIPVVI